MTSNTDPQIVFCYHVPKNMSKIKKKQKKTPKIEAPICDFLRAFAFHRENQAEGSEEKVSKK